MGLPNRDELEGKFDQAKGSAKETVGRAINDRDLEARGTFGSNRRQGSGRVREGSPQSWGGHRRYR